ncbi:GNAT family N-acetyltransferase [Nocardia sp. NPDC051052]|uniref:GNAT family N-acetyltransferase n=1 Tax=Nocardia sp. NPDC051052 TaxID=3364322 RepID=UPI0037898849
MTVTFDAIKDDFFRFTREIVWSTVTSVGSGGRPRSRILHPLWEMDDDRPVGFIATGKTPVKVRHLAANPVVAFSYWSPAQHVVQGEAVATWVADAAVKHRVWNLFMTTPPPLGYDLRQFSPGPDSEQFTVLRLEPERIQVLDGAGFPANFTPRIAVLGAASTSTVSTSVDHAATNGSIVVRHADLAVETEEITALLVDYMTTAQRQLLETFGIQDALTDVSRVRASLQEYAHSPNIVVVAQDSNRGLVGVAGLRILGPGVAEVKRMYVVPDVRGQHVGSRLLDYLLSEAAQRGMSTVRLDTARFMVDAQRLYRSRGFVERPPYPQTEIPQGLQRYWIFFELRTDGLVDEGVDEIVDART